MSAQRSNGANAKYLRKTMENDDYRRVRLSPPNPKYADVNITVSSDNVSDCWRAQGPGMQKSRVFLLTRSAPASPIISTDNRRSRRLPSRAAASKNFENSFENIMRNWISTPQKAKKKNNPNNGGRAGMLGCGFFGFWRDGIPVSHNIV